MDRTEKALTYFQDGYNCAESVMMAYAPHVGLTVEQGRLMASGFGGGIGGRRETCGTVSAMVAITGLKCHAYDKDNLQDKTAFYARVRELVGAFEERMGSVNCRTLLQNAKVIVSHNPSARNEAYYAKRPCARFVETACDILEEKLFAAE